MSLSILLLAIKSLRSNKLRKIPSHFKKLSPAKTFTIIKLTDLAKSYDSEMEG